jgi:hypothetical protein
MCLEPGVPSLNGGQRFVDQAERHIVLSRFPEGFRQVGEHFDAIGIVNR